MLLKSAFVWCMESVVSRQTGVIDGLYFRDAILNSEMSIYFLEAFQ